MIRFVFYGRIATETRRDPQPSIDRQATRVQDYLATHAIATEHQRLADQPEPQR